MTRQTGLFMVLLLWLGAAGCPRQDPAALTFAVGGAPAELKVWESLIEDFQRQSGIAVRMLRQPTDSDLRRQALVVPLQARQADPDVFLMDVVWLAQFAASDWLEPLQERMARDGIDEGVFFAPVLDLVDRYRGAVVALPIYVDGGLLYYRRDLLEKYGFSGPPRTWQELVEQAGLVQDQMRESDPEFSGFVWQGAQYEGLICTFQEVAASGGGGLTAGEGGLGLDGPANRKALQFMRDLIHRHRISPPSTFTEMREEEVREAFQRGAALFERNWPYAWPLHQQPGSPVRDKTGIAPLPHFPGGQSVSTLGGWHVGISSHSDAKEQSWALVRFLLERRTQKRLALELGWNPGRRDLYGDPQVLARHPHFAELRQVFENLLPRPVLPYYSRLSVVVQRHLNAALAGDAAPGQALRAAQREADEIAARYEKE